MAYPTYVLLPADVEWTPVPDTEAQRPAPVRWYLRQLMPLAATQMGVLVPGEGALLEQRLADVARRAEELGGIAVDVATQQVIDPSAVHVHV
ncbi:MAG: hypothetical protein JWO69_303 [Thermoleophilia bacterium]|jgi:hypothetical protein|nr:hypothetical protein [Thermoleophilia bacterium]